MASNWTNADNVDDHQVPATGEHYAYFNQSATVEVWWSDVTCHKLVVTGGNVTLDIHGKNVNSGCKVTGGTLTVINTGATKKFVDGNPIQVTGGALVLTGQGVESAPNIVTVDSTGYFVSTIMKVMNGATVTTGDLEVGNTHSGELEIVNAGMWLGGSAEFAGYGGRLFG